jgi:large subunit ribosomal protein L18
MRSHQRRRRPHRCRRLTLDKDVRGKAGATTESAQDVGRRIAEACHGCGRDPVVFDRGGFLFHGRVKALAMPRAKADWSFK